MSTTKAAQNTTMVVIMTIALAMTTARALPVPTSDDGLPAPSEPCSSPPIKNVMRLTTDESMRFIASLRQMTIGGEHSKFSQVASTHGNWQESCAHSRPNFMAWHRVAMLTFEEAFRDAHEELYGNRCISFPYWDPAELDGISYNETYSLAELARDDPLDRLTAKISLVPDVCVPTTNAKGEIEPTELCLDDFVKSFGDESNLKHLLGDHFEQMALRAARAAGRRSYGPPEISYYLLTLGMTYARKFLEKTEEGSFPSAYAAANNLEQSLHQIPHAMGYPMTLEEDAAWSITFWLHHQNVDRYWEAYLTSRKREAVEAELRTDSTTKNTELLSFPTLCINATHPSMGRAPSDLAHAADCTTTAEEFAALLGRDPSDGAHLQTGETWSDFAKKAFPDWPGTPIEWGKWPVEFTGAQYFDFELKPFQKPGGSFWTSEGAFFEKAYDELPKLHRTQVPDPSEREQIGDLTLADSSESQPHFTRPVATRADSPHTSTLEVQLGGGGSLTSDEPSFLAHVFAVQGATPSDEALEEMLEESTKRLLSDLDASDDTATLRESKLRTHPATSRAYHVTTLAHLGRGEKASAATPRALELLKHQVKVGDDFGSPESYEWVVRYTTSPSGKQSSIKKAPRTLPLKVELLEA